MVRCPPLLQPPVVHFITDAGKLPLVGRFTLPVLAGTLELFIGFQQEVVVQLIEGNANVPAGEHCDWKEGGHLTF